MSNRSLIPVLVGGLLVLGVVAPGDMAHAQTPSTAAPVPACGLEGEIGEGRGRILALGSAVGYRGEMTIPLAKGPNVVLTVTSEFAPHRPAVDRIALVIGPDGASDAGARLAGAFGSREGRRFTVGRQGEVPDSDRAWFDEMMGGGVLTAAVGEETAPVAYPARQFQADYDYLLDLLQLVANWEVAGLCVNRAAG